jgi:murein DD-endopeptidase MepM/ murein hydrolase activator NlpD
MTGGCNQTPSLGSAGRLRSQAEIAAGFGDWALLRILAVSVAATALIVASAGNPDDSCAGLLQPVDGPVAATFAPRGRYAGHWGVDWLVPEGTGVRPAGAGIVSFVGSVAGNLTTTVDHGGGLRTSYSYLGSVAVTRGQLVTESTRLGTSGIGHNVPALHFSVRLGDTYVDPLATMGCRLSTPSRALRLVPARESD